MTSDSAAISLDQRQLASSQDQFERGTRNSVTDREITASSIPSQVHIEVLSVVCI